MPPRNKKKWGEQINTAIIEYSQCSEESKDEGTEEKQKICLALGL